MKERPILFSGPMVNAILDGRKTQTRRVVKPQGAILTDELARSLGVRPPETKNQPVIACPYGAVGDRLWVRETWFSPPKPNNECIGFAADREYPPDVVYRKRPSIHMPRWASRITLEVTGVRVERLQDISDADCVAEGCPGWYSPMHPDQGNTDGRTPSEEYRDLWESIHGPKSWEANDWVWVVEFARITG